jgi:multiple sugar transport system substrate-binding protein
MSSKHLSRRGFLKGAMIGGASLVAAACAPAAPAPAPAAAPAEQQPAATEAPKAAAPAASGPVQIDVWTGWTEAAAKNIEEILAGYNKSQSAVVAKHVVVPEAMNQKLLAAVSAGNPPACAVVFGASVAYQLAAQKAILPLDEVGKPEQVSALKQWMLPAIWDLGTYGGKFYYASMWNQCLGVFVNTKIAQEKGVDPAKPPATLEELDAVYQKLTTFDASGNINVLGGEFNWIEMIFGRFLGEFVSADGAKITANHPNNVKALEWLTKYWQTVGVQKLQDYYASLQGRGERSAGNDPFLSGLRATYVTGPWEFDTIKRYKPDGFEFTVWPYPGPAGQTKKGMYTYGDGWIIPKGTKEVSAAWDIIGTMTGATGDRDVYTSLFMVWQCVNGPVSPTMIDWPKFKTEVSGKCPGYEEIFLKDLFNSDQYLYPPKIPTSASYASLLTTECEKARLGQKSPKEALDFVTSEAQKELDNWTSQSG